MLSLSPTNVILIITKRVFFGTDSGGPLAYEGTKSRLGAIDTDQGPTTPPRAATFKVQNTLFYYHGT